MKGTLLHKTDKGWVVKYTLCCAGDNDTECKGAKAICLPTDHELPLHPDDIRSDGIALGFLFEEGKEVEFSIEAPFDPENPPYQVAKLIQPKQQKSWETVGVEFFEWSLGTNIRGTAANLLSFLKENYHPPTKK